jgi:hypothetical protein
MTPARAAGLGKKVRVTYTLSTEVRASKTLTSYFDFSGLGSGKIPKLHKDM